ncbi:apoptosis regulator BAX-like [Cyprinodon tularosa]|uniref:apoptosis regulator BAX-like n=1 Tax=Cyprinodon tularosa TaxID=77115 RepID=UPI0018E27774|nr:apoptosis regulator BAX-like [Cyprinodon tularosa]
MASTEEGGNRGTFTDTILDELVLLLKNFVLKWIQRHALSKVPILQEALGVTALCDPQQQKVSDAFQVVADEVDGEGGIKKLIEVPSFTPSKEVFVKIVRELFSDGEINWGRVVTVFCFAGMFVLKAHESKICELIKTIISWIIDFFREKVLGWIKEQGGWEGIFSYVGIPMWQFLGIFLAGVVTTLVVVHKMRAE